MSDRYQAAGPEPTLEELLADPIVLLVLARDAIDPDDLRRYLDGIRARLRPEPVETAAAA